MPDDDPQTPADEPGTETPTEPSTEDPTDPTETDPVVTDGDDSGGSGGDDAGDDPVPVAVTVVRPIVGGGLGDMKIAIVEFTGTAPQGGFPYPFKKDPVFMMSDKGAVSLSDGGITVTAGAKVVFFFK